MQYQCLPLNEIALPPDAKSFFFYYLWLVLLCFSSFIFITPIRCLSFLPSFPHKKKEASFFVKYFFLFEERKGFWRKFSRSLNDVYVQWISSKLLVEFMIAPFRESSSKMFEARLKFYILIQQKFSYSKISTSKCLKLHRKFSLLPMPTLFNSL